MNMVKELILKHLSCSYVLYCRKDLDSYLSFEEYCSRYDETLKNEINFIHDIMNSAKKIMKKEKKTKIKKS